MIISILALFVVVVATGIAVKLRAHHQPMQLKNLLIFGGAYLFSITVIHLLPEVFKHANDQPYLGYFVLLGFFFQLFLEQFSQGAEHGHIHTKSHHNHFYTQPVFLMLSLSIHAFLEGTLLGQPEILDHEHQGFPLLMGIILHKIPAAIALVSVLISWLGNSTRVYVYLLIFALASPFGLLMSHFLNTQTLITQQQLLILFAIVSGNFLHISTTIFFETNPDHRLNFRKFLIGLLGALAAILAELLF